MPLEDAITARSRTSWHLHADETSWHVFAPRDGDGPAKWWLWVFLGPDTACFVMDPSRAGAVLARHAGIDESGQLTADEDGGPRRLVISSDFYSVYASTGRRLMAWSIFTAGRTSAGISSVPVTPTRTSSSTGHRRGWSGSRTCTPRTGS